MKTSNRDEHKAQQPRVGRPHTATTIERLLKLYRLGILRRRELKRLRRWAFFDL